MSDRSGSAKPIALSNKTKPRFVNLLRPGRLDVEFICECIKGLSCRFDSSQLGVTFGDGVIDEAFAGVCLAVPKDEAATKAALGFVRELEVQAVRVDFSESNAKEAVIPLLEGLRDSEVRVLLHLVQPLAQATQMPDAEATEAWKCFVVDSLDTFAEYIEAVELGTTINRAKWSGYNLDGFFAAWQVAYPLVQASGLPLVGPNVTDFEPQYNAGVLSMLKHRECLPEIHSNNMFAERAIEPEALDRKILGESFKHLHGYDLIKKLRLVASIARRNGVSRNWSTCAFWTLPRIQRILTASEEQMADYLARYYILCASEGSFERVYWGPLVSGREGLLDDGTGLPEDRRIRDVVSYYRELPGESSQWRRRAAFYAFKTVKSMISGACYVERVYGGNGLEVHAFEQGDQILHVVWTRNGKLASSNDLYSEFVLSSLDSIYSRDGEEISSVPHFFSESPVYLTWDRKVSVQVSEVAAVVPNAIAARAESHRDYFSYQDGAWRGVVYAESQDDAHKLIEALKPEAIQPAASETTMRNARNAIWTVEDPVHPSERLVVKSPVRIAWHKLILDRKKPSKSLRSWNGTSELMRRGIETPKVIAYFEHRDASKPLENWFICDHANTNLSVRKFFNQYVSGVKVFKGFTYEEFAAELLEFIHRMHWRGVYFRDLSGGNVLVRIEEGNRLVFSLIDTARARFANQRFSRSKRIADLKRLVHKLDAERQEHFMEAYLKKENARFTGYHRLTFQLYAIKASLKRVKRKSRKKFASK